MGDVSSSGGPRIVVDARALHNSGIGRYLREVLAELLRDRRFAEIVLLGDPGDLGSFVSEYGATAAVRIEAHRGGFYTPQAQLSWQSLRRQGRIAADLALFPHYDAPLFGLPRRSVVAVQDLTHFKVSAAFPKWKRAGAAVLFDRVVRRAERIVVSSASTRADLLERIPAVTGKIEVIPLGVSASFRACEAGGCATCPVTRGVGPYLLCVGNRKPHKNLVVAVETLARLLPEWPELRLVVGGRRFGVRDEVDERAAALGISHAVVDRGSVSDDELRCLYTHCEALLFPSLYEGFGLPALEAMACGAPVIASNRASLPEVVADAGLLVDALVPDEFAAAVRRLRAEPALRAVLVRRGRARAAALSWKRTAQCTLDVLYNAFTAAPARIAPSDAGGR